MEMGLFCFSFLADSDASYAMHPVFHYGTWGKWYCYELARGKYNKPFLVPDLH